MSFMQGCLHLCPLHFPQANTWVNFMFPTRKFTSIARNFQSFVKSCFFFCRKEKLKNQNRFMEKMSVVYKSCKHVSFKHTPKYELKANFLIIKIKSFFSTAKTLTARLKSNRELNFQSHEMESIFALGIRN